MKSYCVSYSILQIACVYSACVRVVTFVYVCERDVNIQEVNAYVPVMSTYIHSAWLGAVLELIRWNCNPQLCCSYQHTHTNSSIRIKIKTKLATHEHHIETNFTNTVNLLFICSSKECHNSKYDGQYACMCVSERERWPVWCHYVNGFGPGLVIKWGY